MKESDTKKEIKDIMLEMESLSEKQIATTLTEQTLKELMASNGINATGSGFSTDPTCIPDCSNCITTLDFCAKTSISRCFTVNIDNTITTIQYNSSLFCFTDPCPCPVTVTPGVGCPTFCITLYPRRVVGAIQYRAFTGNAVGEACFSNGDLCTNGIGAISIEGSLCVNNIVSYQQCPPILSEAQPKPIPVGNLTVTVNASAEKCEDCTSLTTGSPCEDTVVKFTGSFTLLGTCPIPSCNWLEYPYNPVYEPATSAYYQTVRYDQTGFAPYGPSTFYKMWYDYASTGGIALATSSDGINWSFNSNMNGLKEEGGQPMARHSRVLFSRDGFGINVPYRIWYWVYGDPYIVGSEPKMIRTARSVDGVTWTNDIIITQDSNSPLLPFSIYNGSYGPADILYFPQNSSSSIDKTNPFNNRYVMYYDVTNGDTEEIALAVSANGEFWSRIGNQPVLPRGGPGQWDANYACEGAVVIRLASNNFKMWYSGGSITNHEGIGCASSTDGINWTKFSENPVFSISQDVPWRTARTYNPWALYDPLQFSGHGDSTCFKLWLTGGDEIDHPDIGYATMPSLSEPVCH